MTLADNILSVRQKIVAACRDCHRNPDEVLLLAVSKTQAPETIAQAYRLGLRHFGENYCQEALVKQAALAAFDITWHFIGPIQSNKTKPIARHFSWVHSVDSLKIAKRLSEQRPDNLPPLNICLQVNVSEESSKSGIALEDLAELCFQVETLPNLSLRGVMAIPAPFDSFEEQRQPYRRLMLATEALKRPELSVFSFGMSDDLHAALAEGSTLLRIGTALFGKRQKPGASSAL